MSDVLLHAIQQAAEGLLPLDELDAAIHNSGLLPTSAHERSAGAAPIDVEVLHRAVIEELAVLWGEPSDFVSEAVRPLLAESIAQRYARLLDAAPSPAADGGGE